MNPSYVLSPDSATGHADVFVDTERLCGMIRKVCQASSNASRQAEKQVSGLLRKCRLGALAIAIHSVLFPASTQKNLSDFQSVLA